MGRCFKRKRNARYPRHQTFALFGLPILDPAAFGVLTAYQVPYPSKKHDYALYAVGIDDVKVAVALDKFNVGEHFQVVVYLPCGAEAAGFYKLGGSFGLLHKGHKQLHSVLTAYAAEDCGCGAVLNKVQ